MTKPERGKTGRWGWAVQLGVVLIALILLQWWRALPLASGEAPPLTGLLVTGDHFDLGELHGRPVLVYFWGSWCPVCRMSNGDIDAIAAEHSVITVAMQSGDAMEVRDYLAREGLSFPVLADGDGALASRWGVHAVPTSFVIDGGGQIRFSSVGYTTGAGLRARLWATRALESASSRLASLGVLPIISEY